jgi:PAS domain S-box-containing protein
MTERAAEPDPRPSVEDLLQANAELQARLDEAEETIRAIQQGGVDAFVMEELGKHRVYTLEGADGPYRLFVEEMQQGVATLAQDGTIAYANRRLAEMLKVTQPGLTGATLADFVTVEDLPYFGHLVARGASGSSGEVAFRPRDGSTLPAYLTFNHLPADERLTCVFVTDLTTQKDHEQLAAAQQELAAADRRKNEFLAMLAHELRNPLAPIRNAVTLLRLTGDKETINVTCELLDRQVGQMVRLVDDLLDVSRITRNKIELRKERLELANVIDQAVESIRPRCRKLEHELSISLPSTPIFLDGDPARLTQVFVNVLDNACKYTEKGGRISLSAEVSPAMNGSGQEVAVRVADTGVGIAQHEIARIFDMFAQVDASLERSKSGLGIGLTLVRNLVELHGGRVEARSDGPGTGSEFIVRLPVQLRRTRSASIPPSIEIANDERYKILVVDDNRDSVESLAMLLKLMGHATVVAMDGREALEKAAAARPDVVLLDIGLPGMNGYEACRRIRAEDWGRDMVLIAQTGWGQEEDRRRSEEVGFDAHLVKPVDPAALTKLLGTLPAMRRASPSRREARRRDEDNATQ